MAQRTPHAMGTSPDLNLARRTPDARVPMHAAPLDSGEPEGYRAAVLVPRRSRMTRRRATFGLAVGAAALAIVTAIGSMAGAAAATAVGEVAAGQTSFTYVGQISQDATLAVDVGYLTSVAGLDEATMFTGSDPLSRTEASARFTYFASAKLETRSVNGGVFVTSGTATTTLYLNDAGGATFDDPTSFKNGQVIATYESRWQDIVNVQAPNQGVATVTSDETQGSATPFTLAGTQYTIGHQGLTLRLAFTGEGTRTDPTAPKATILYGGGAVALASGTGSSGSGSGSATSSSSPGTSAWTWVALGLAILALMVAGASLARGAVGRTA
jgi:hypothetical protein